MGTENSVAILYITKKGLDLADRLTGLYARALVTRFNSNRVAQLWDTQSALIFIMAAGIVVRTIAPLIKDKRRDPAVVVLDEKGRFAISLLSGHLGGANECAEEIAAFLEGKAVITTSSDVNNMTSIDIWARQNNLVIENWKKVPRTATRFLNRGLLRVYTDVLLDLPDHFIKVDEPEAGDVIITNKSDLPGKDKLILRPRNLVIGIGCNKAAQSDEIEEAVKKILKGNNLSVLSIRSLATIDRKGNEPGLLAFAEKYNLEINTFTPGELNTVKGILKSEAAFKATGAQAVAEPAALLASGADKLLVAKQKMGNVTIAVAEKQLKVKSEKLKMKGKKPGGRIYIVGTGPGGIEHITPHAQNAIEASDVIVGYDTYLNLIQGLIKGKEIISTGMTKEVERCRKAVELAISGETVSVISGGDPGIFAMAGLVFEILKNHNALCDPAHVAVEVIPGISALNACAARLGAPLMNDFAVISLSDRLTPWKLIEKRLEAASMSDLVIVLYNPKSTGRQGHIKKAADIVLQQRSPETPVGIVKAAMREDEHIAITNLEGMLNHDIDMQTTVIIGNSQSFIWNNRMITPRGYENKFKI